ASHTDSSVLPPFVHSVAHHSFPTRRSSDLNRDNMQLFEACARHLKPLEFYGRYDHTVPVDPAVLKWFLDKASPNYHCKLVPDILDRKSTRLNSSHVKISYAVFCLKKKNSKH